MIQRLQLKIALAFCTLSATFFSIGLCQDSEKQEESWQWKSYALPKRVAAMTFPAKPTAKVKSVDIPDLGEMVNSEMVFVDQAKKCAFLLVVVKYPDQNKFDPKKAMDSIVNGQAQRGKLLAKDNIEKTGMEPGIDMMVETKNQQMVFRTRIFIDPKGPKAYSCQVLGSSEFVKSKEALKFLDSLNTKPDDKAVVVEPVK